MFDQLKPLIQNGERYIVVEGGRPEYVLMRFDDYSALVQSKRSNPGLSAPARGPAEWERANTELGEDGSLGTTFHSPFTAEALPPSPDPTTIRLEDLPL